MSLLRKASARTRERLWRLYKSWRTNTRRQEERGQQMRTRMHGDTTNTEVVESKDDLNIVREESDAKDEDMYKVEN